VTFYEVIHITFSFQTSMEFHFFGGWKGNERPCNCIILICFEIFFQCFLSSFNVIVLILPHVLKVAIDSFHIFHASSAKHRVKKKNPNLYFQFQFISLFLIKKCVFVIIIMNHYSTLFLINEAIFNFQFYFSALLCKYRLEIPIV